LTQTYGIFQEYYEGIHLSGRSSSDISWIGSMQSFLVVIVGVVAGPLFDTGWLKPCLFIGSFLIVFGMVCSWEDLFMPDASGYALISGFCR
jgi:hypothetical protein